MLIIVMCTHYIIIVSIMLSMW